MLQIEANGETSSAESVQHFPRLFEPLEDDRRVVPTEAERVRDGDAHVGLARLVRDVVEVALRILDLVVDRRRQLAVANREDREERLDRAGCAQAVTGRTLRRRD